MMIGSQFLFGQVTGWVKEKETKHNCPDASIYLLRVDSSLLEQTHSRQDGNFLFPGRISPGHYNLLILYPGCESLYRKLVLTDTLPVDVGVLFLMPKSDSLQAVIVRPSALRPQFKGDTVEYNTSNIKMRPNAAVEEMLGLLPGLQIDADGNITYNGEKISRLLVDGEDLFGSQPTIVTRNFDASHIDKVQILDRKSDQAMFTGIDDGSRTKTLNLVMKQDSKNDYFGKVEGGADAEGIYSAHGLLADLQGREQITAFGFASNTGSTGFTSDVGGSSTGIIALNGNIDALGASAGTGIPRFFGTALHYANTWDGSADHFVENYQYSNVFTQPVTSSISLQTLPDSLYSQYQQSHSTNQQNQHWSYGTYDGVFDSLTAIRLFYHISSTTARNQYGDTALSTFNGVDVNSSLLSIQDNVSRQNIGGSASYRIRARHNAGRVFTISTGWTSINSATNGYIYSIDQFYQPNGSLESLDTTDQRKQIVNESHNFNSGITYTEPLWRNVSLGLTYGLNYTGSNILQGTYDKAGGKYDLFVDTLSSHLQGNNLNKQGSVNLQGVDGRLSYTLGTGIVWYFYRQRDLQADSTSQYRYLNITPHLRISYTPDRATHFILEYSSNTQQPSIAQLQPVVNNSNPLLITLGNPSLRPGFNQAWNLNFSQVKDWIYYLSLSFGTTSNSISTKTTTNSLGQEITQSVNVNGDKNAAGKFSIYKRILGLDLGLNVGGTYTRTVNYVNTDLNRSDSYIEIGGFSVGYYSAREYSFQLNTQFSYFDTRSSVDAAAPVHYWTQSHSVNLNLFFIHNFEVHTDATYTWQQSTSAFPGSTSVLLWNASVLRNFMHNRLAVKFQANNLLNVNAGISRSSSANLNTENSTNILGRYWLFSVAYHFDHQWKKK